MSEPKFINLDPLAGDGVEVQLNNKKYTIKPASVVYMIRFWKALEENADIAFQIEQSLDFLYKLCDEAKADQVFDGLSMEQLDKLLKAVTGNIEGQYAKIGDTKEDISKKKSTSESPSQSS